MRRVLAFSVLGATALLGPLALSAHGQQRVSTPSAPVSTSDVRQTFIAIPNQVPYVREGWEIPGLEMPHLADGLVSAVHEDDDSLKFQVGNELGAFHPAPAGGSAFFGQGRAIFGITAPPVLPSRVLRPLGSGDTGDRFLGAAPAISDTTVIPKIGDTYDLRRHSYAFLGGVPALAPTAPEGTTQFPLKSAVEADKNGSLPDNVPTTPTTTPPSTPTTTPPPTTPGTTPPSSAPPATTPPSSPPATTPPTTPPTSAPPSGTTTTVVPTTTIPPTTTTSPTTTIPPTTTTAPTTTIPPTTTTTEPPTTTTTVPPTTTTTQPPNNNNPSTSFVLGNSRDEATWCVANDPAGPQDASCDKVFDPSVHGLVQPGVAQRQNLTLWNVSPDSDTDAVALKVYAPSNCVSGAAPGATATGSGNLCDGLRLRIDLYNSITDRNAASNGTCLVGCTNNGITLNSFRSSFNAFSNGLTLTTSFPVNAKVFLVLTAILPDTGHTSGGTGNDNIYLGRTASLPLTWQMISA